MSGNVAEWCGDWLGNYTAEPKTNPTGPATGPCRVLRGGFWAHSARNSRVSFRTEGNVGYNSDTRTQYWGFRLALSQ